MADPQATDRRASNRRYAVIAAAFVLVLLLVVFGSLFDACGTSDGTDPADRIAPSEEVTPAPGVE